MKKEPKPSPLPESVEESKDWTKPDENGNVDVPDYLMPLLNKLGFQLRFHTISGEGEAITLVRMTSIAEKFFKAHHSAEVERLKNALQKIASHIQHGQLIRDAYAEAKRIAKGSLKEK